MSDTVLDSGDQTGPSSLFSWNLQSGGVNNTENTPQAFTAEPLLSWHRNTPRVGLVAYATIITMLIILVRDLGVCFHVTLIKSSNFQLKLQVFFTSQMIDMTLKIYFCPAF